MQRIVIAVVALVLVVPIGAVGVAQMLGGSGGAGSSAASDPADTRAAVDPAAQPRPSPTTAPAAPAALTEQTSEGAQATLRYVLETYAYMMATGDTAAWSSAIDPNCQVCVQFVAEATQLHQQGGWGVGGEFTVSATSFEGTGDPPASGVATADFQEAALAVIDDPAKEPLTQGALSGQIQARLAWDGERWRIGDLAIADAAGPGVSDGGGAASDGGS